MFTRARFETLCAAAFWFAALGAFVFAILPAEDAPKLANSDKIEHMLAFLTLSILGRLAYPRRSAWRLAIGLALFGAGIELTQMIPALHRDASIGDWIADCGAALAGIILIGLIVKMIPAFRPDRR